MRPYIVLLSLIYWNVKYRCFYLYEIKNKDTEAYKEAYKEGYKEEYEEYNKVKGEYNKLNLKVTLNNLGFSLLALVY